MQAKRGVGLNHVLESAARLNVKIEWGGTGSPVRAEMTPATVDLPPRSRPKSVQPGLGMGVNGNNHQDKSSLRDNAD